jgi:opacity protein-like surface antigen
MAGIGFGKDIFGYPNAVEDLQKGQTVYVEVGKELINSSLGLSYRGAVGVDYKVTEMVLLGVEYSYMRSATTANLDDHKTFYMSSHSVAVNIGVHL